MIGTSPRIRAIIQQASDDLCVTVAETIGPSHQARPVEARARAMRAIRSQTKLSLIAIGKILGGRHHTTIMHALTLPDRYFPMIPRPPPPPEPDPKVLMTVPQIEDLPPLSAKPKATGPPKRTRPMTLAERLKISERRSVARVLYIHGPTYGFKPYARFEVLTNSNWPRAVSGHPATAQPDTDPSPLV